jgi:DNA-directed RNA polymerase alpha subunit
MSFFNVHEDGCTPLQPCRRCKALSFLREKLNMSDFAELLMIFGEVQNALIENADVVDISTPLDKYGEQFSVRVRNSLYNENIKTLGDLLRYKESDLLRIPNFGRMSLIEVKEVVKQTGHKLGELPRERD